MNIVFLHQCKTPRLALTARPADFGMPGAKENQVKSKKVKKPKTRKRFARSFGPYGCRVRVFQRPGGLLWLSVRAGGSVATRESLGHRDRALGVEQAKDRQAQLALGIAPVGRTVTLAAILAKYLERMQERAAQSAQQRATPSGTSRGRLKGDLAATVVKEVERSLTFWTAMLGAKAVDAITLNDVDRAIEKRVAGSVTSRGVPVQNQAERRPVGMRTAGAELEWLRAALRWATLRAKLIATNPLAGMAIPNEANPRRLVATADRYEATRAVANSVQMEINRGTHEMVTSYLQDLLDLVYSTGRRLSSVCGLEVGHIDLVPPPYGTIKWVGVLDKQGNEYVTPIDILARRTLDRILVDREIGVRARWPESACLFPSPRNPMRPMSGDLASDWLLEAETLAELPKLAGTLWHAYRRGYATARKPLPTADVMYLAGWKTERSVQLYQQADQATLRNAVMATFEIRDPKP